MINNEKIKYFPYVFILGIIGIVLGVVLNFEPIAQDIGFHAFSDQKTICCIPHFWNVISNLPFLFVGFLGLWKLYRRELILDKELKICYCIFFIAISLVNFGSMYYHWNPSNSTLFWDRLPICIAFMSIFSIIIGEYINSKLGKIILLPMIIASILSLIYWYISEMNGVGDLRIYLLVQIIPISISPIILLFFSSKFSMGKAYWILFVSYVIAIFLEKMDKQVHETIFLMSGHPLKHIAIAIGLYIVLNSYKKRKVIK